MNIVIDCKNLALFSAGISGFFKPILKELISKKSDIHFFLVTPSEFDTSFIDEFSNWELVIVKRPHFLGNAFTTVLYDCLIYPLGLKRLSGSLLLSPYYDFLIPKKFSGRSIITIHDLCFWDLAHLYKSRVRLYHQLFLFFNLRKVSRVLTVSKSSHSRLMNLYGSKIEKKLMIIYNTFEKKSSNYLPKIVSEKRGRSKIILYTGGYEVRKNIANLLGALKLLSSNLDLRLYFTGSAENNVDLIELIERLSLNEVVHFTGVISTEEVKTLYCNCDLVVNVSLCEGFGRSNLEAISMNKPLVCSDIDVFRELVGDMAIYCDPLDQGSISDAICMGLELKSVNYNFDYSRFSLRQNSNQLISAIDEVLNG